MKSKEELYSLIKKEKQELKQNIDKLKSFIDSEEFNNIEKDEQNLLIMQLGFMKSYFEILVERTFIYM